MLTEWKKYMQDYLLVLFTHLKFTWSCIAQQSATDLCYVVHCKPQKLLSPTLPNYLVLICIPKLITHAQGQCFFTCLDKISSFLLLPIPPVFQLQIQPLVYLWEGGKTSDIPKRVTLTSHP